MIYRSNSSQETEKIAEKIMKDRNTNVFCLYGDLGAGKTTFVRGAVRSLGLTDTVQSPTFTFERVYAGGRKQKFTVYHFDLYRLNKVDPLAENDLIEALEDTNGIVFIEWAEKIARDLLPPHRADIFLEHSSLKKGTESDRKITVKKRTTDKDVSALIEEFNTPLHVRRHCAAVCNFAHMLGEKLRAKGKDINLELVRHGGMLHDLVRVVDFRTFEPATFPDPVTKKDIEIWRKLRAQFSGLHHAAAGAEILEERGFYEVAEIVRTHRFSQIQKGFSSWEEKLVYYADKRAMHDKIVPLRDRLADGRTRNLPGKPHTKEDDEMIRKVYKLEKEILTIANMKATDS